MPDLRSLILLATALIPLQAVAEAPDFKSAAISPSAQLNLCNTAKVTALGVFHIADAALYLADCRRTDSVLGPVPKQYQVVASRNLSGKRLANSARKLLKRNLSKELLQQNAAAFDCINRAYEDIQAGERYDIRYDPKDGLSLLRNGELVSNCPCAPSAAGYFAIWFGDKSLSADTRSQLLAQN